MSKDIIFILESLTFQTSVLRLKRQFDISYVSFTFGKDGLLIATNSFMPIHKDKDDDISMNGSATLHQIFLLSQLPYIT